MDLDELGNKIANLTFYDLKSAWTQAKNYALNISEIEAKVNEATSDDPWGASSTLMQEIAGATHNFQDFNEIMPTIFRNFMEKEAREWRQIYKSLQLLEYLVKHGSERVVDDARTHLGTIKILRNFHYIDEAGKDQGLNVRNRAKELAELLSDVERIRAERRKARANRQKYQGAGNSDFVPGSGGGRYGGFGSDAYYSGAFSGSASGSAAGGYPGGGSSAAARESFDEYDAGDDDTAGGATAGRSSARAPASGRAAASAPAPPSKKKQEEAKVADLFSFDDDEPTPAAGAKQGGDAFGDDFDDFQAAPASSAAAAKPAAAPAPAPAAASKPSGGNDIFDFLGGGSSSGTTSAPRPSGAGVLSPSSMRPQPSGASASSTTSLPSMGGGPALTPQAPMRPSLSSTNSSASASTSTSAKAGGGLSGFDDLWASSTGSSSAAGNSSGKKTMADLAKEKSGAGVWGSAGAATTPTGMAGPRQGGQAGQKKDLFDLL